MKQGPDFEVLWKEYYPKVTVYLKSSFGFLPGTDLEDHLQEIFLKAYRCREQYDPRYGFSTWLYTLARNHCLDLLRKKSPVFSGVDPDELAGSPDPVPEAFLSAESRAEVRRALGELPEAERTMVFLRYYEDLSCREIARVLDLPEGTVKSRFHAIRGKLEPRLKEAVGI